MTESSIPRARFVLAGALSAGSMIALPACAPDAVEGNLDVDESSTTEARGFRLVDNPIPGRYVVVLADDHVERNQLQGDGVSTLSSQLAHDYAGAVVRNYRTALSGFAAEMSAENARALSEDPRVAYVEEDGEVTLDGVQEGATWGLDRIDQRELPLDGRYELLGDGSGVTAYVIDSGIHAEHVDFEGRVRADGFTTIDDDLGTGDCNGHGTHVAGTIAGAEFGVAKNAELVSVRVFGCRGGGSFSDIIAAVDYVTEDAEGPAVANMSLGGGGSQALDDAVRRSVEAGITYVVAAGNNGGDACQRSPARSDLALTVGASAEDDSRASFSNHGECVDIFAPGQDIESAWPTDDSATNAISGTSMASPHVAGAAALYLEVNPDAAPADVAEALVENATPDQLSGIGGDTPNAMLYTGFIAGGGGGGGEDPDPPEEGTPREGHASGSVPQGQNVLFQPLSVLPGTEFFVEMTGTGDPDLYVRFDDVPTLTAFDCRPFLYGADESCVLEVPDDASEAYIMIRGYTDATFSIEASWVEP